MQNLLSSITTCAILIGVFSASSLAGICDRVSITKIGYGQNPEYSPDGKSIAYDLRDDSGTYQVYVKNLQYGVVRCITCETAINQPSLLRHKGYPTWHPSGRYLAMQVELASHIGDSPNDPKGCSNPHDVAEPGRGFFNGIQVYDLYLRKWTAIRQFNGYDSKLHGVLTPRFSKDGKMLSWSELYAGTDIPEGTCPPLPPATLNPFGKWVMGVATFSTYPVPTLSNHTFAQPGNGTFYENQGFSPDGKWLVFTTDGIKDSIFKMDIWKWNITTNQTVQLTDSDSWDEHARWSNDGKKIAYMSSSPFLDYDPYDMRTLRSEAFIMAADGTYSGQISWFNSPGADEYNPEPNVAIGSTFNTDGTELVLGQLLLGPSYDNGKDRILWKIKFAGRCGG